MRVKTNELTGAALDWAVALCEVGPIDIKDIDDPHFYSTDWSEGGPIIEREKVCVEYMAGAGDGGLDVWVAEVLHEDKKYGGVMSSAGQGPTPLIAAMRCYVASKLGDEVEIPEELK
jgi:hypothetical protein